MERRRFALSWGRKIFFGLGWPLLAVLSLIFLKSGIIPKDTASLIYYLVTTVGYYGLVTAILYFILYVPLALLFPTYYFVRMWSAFLILTASAAILVDGAVFAEFRFHINHLIMNIVTTQGPAFIFNGSFSPFIIIAGITLFLFFVLWIRGEWLWRVMQRRFSNPVKNWYLLLIIFCLGISHLVWRNHRTVFFGNEITLASIFPMNYQEILYPKVHSVEVMGQASVNYPKKDLKCKPKSLPNLIFVLMDGMDNKSVSEIETPFLLHLQQHGMNFTSHLSGGGTMEDNLFRLIYGIPASYRPEVSEPALIHELEKAGYEMAIFSGRRIPGLPFQQNIWADWSVRERDPVKPVFLFFDLGSGSPLDLDTKLKTTFTDLNASKLLQGSTIIVTGTQKSEWEMVPMTMISSDREKGQWDHRTTHYDVTPTIMRKILNCSTNLTAYTYGKVLTDLPTQDWEIFGNESSFRIADFTNHNIIESDWHGRISSGETSRGDLVLKASREISRFYRR